MRITYKFRLYPSSQQEQILLWTLDKCRFVYNDMLNILSRQNKSSKKWERPLPYSYLQELKKKHPELKNVFSQVLQNQLYRLFWNLKKLARLKKKGKKVGKLRFKGDGWFKTFTYTQFGFKVINTGKRLALLHLSKIGDIPIRMHRNIKRKIKAVTIKRCGSGKWFACFTTEHDNAKLKTAKQTIGIDLGIKYFLTDSKGRQIENPKFYESMLRKIKMGHKKLSRKKKNSKNREKQKLKLAKLYEKLVNQKEDFLHKLSHFYANEYDILCVENLNISGMIKNRRLAQKIWDVSWAKFLHMLYYKAERAGSTVIRVNPWRTSKIYKYGELDRDYNASLNILERGLLGLGQSLEPVEIEPLRKLIQVSASSIVEAGSPLVSADEQFTGYIINTKGATIT